jgi:hypothetical protein
LGHGAFKSIHEQQYAVGHIEYALHLAAEVGVTGGINDVDLCAFVSNGHVFGQNSDPTFTFEVVVVEDQFPRRFVLFEQPSGHEHFVHQSRFAMIYVRDNGYIAYVQHSAFFKFGRKGTKISVGRILIFYLCRRFWYPLRMYQLEAGCFTHGLIVNAPNFVIMPRL